ncbi:MAG: hypothetical protein J7K81_01360 [Methanophagales archaeon]|nr:hypothetical protein [Methanophagales archaeon]
MKSLREKGKKAVFREIGDKIYQLELPSDFPRIHAKYGIYHGTFEQRVANEDESLDFFAFGHEVIDDLIDYFRGALTKPSAGIMNFKGHEQANGVLFVYLTEFKGLTTKKKLIPIFLNKNYEFLEDVSNELLKSDVKMLQKADHSDFKDVIADIDTLKNKSNEILMKQLEEEYGKVQEKNAKMVEKELGRSEKLFTFKRNKLYDQIEKEREQLSRIIESGDEKQKRIIPARKGKIRRLQNQIDNLELEKGDKLKKLNELKKVAYNYQLISAVLVS